MKVIKTVLREQTVYADALCNKCGNSLRRDEYGPPDSDRVSLYGMVEYIYKGGYGSDPLEDCTTYTFSLCEPCLSELFKTFIIPVDEGGYTAFEMGGGRTDYTLPERQQKINHIHETKLTQELSEYLLDEDLVVRKYAELRYNQLEKK